jgi:hypothetical protein
MLRWMIDVEVLAPRLSGFRARGPNLGVLFPSETCSFVYESPSPFCALTREDRIQESPIR